MLNFLPLDLIIQRALADTSKETSRLLSQFIAGLHAFQPLLFAFYARQVHLDFLDFGLEFLFQLYACITWVSQYHGCFLRAHLRFLMAFCTFSLAL
jgi:hypothetical protein